MGDVRVSHGELIRFVTAVFSATGMTTSDAKTVAEVLVWANERGIDSHGVARIPGYLKEIEQGKFNVGGGVGISRGSGETVARSTDTSAHAAAAILISALPVFTVAAFVTNCPPVSVCY
jgi:LDH2 family malate/lactate/ureidoglycolate dehydrogenase